MPFTLSVFFNETGFSGGGLTSCLKHWFFDSFLLVQTSISDCVLAAPACPSELTPDLCQYSYCTWICYYNKKVAWLVIGKLSAQIWKNIQTFNDWHFIFCVAWFGKMTVSCSCHNVTAIIALRALGKIWAQFHGAAKQRKLLWYQSGWQSHTALSLDTSISKQF